MFPRILIIIALAFSAYAIVLPAPFKTMDDRVSIVENPALRSTKDIPKIFQEGFFRDKYYYRPLVNLSFLGEYQLFGLNHFYYNLNNLLLHAVNAILVFVIASMFLGEVRLALWVGVLFAIHPLHAEAVGNIAGRTILLCAFFVLSAFYCFLLFERKRRLPFLFLAFGFFGLGLLTKESAGIFPAVLAAYLWYKPQGNWKQKISWLAGFAVVILAYILWRHHLSITQMARPDGVVTFLLGFITFLKSMFEHLRLFIFPVGLYFDRGTPFFRSFAEAGVGLTVLIWSAIAAGYWQCYKKIPVQVKFLILWAAIELFPTSQIVANIVIQPWMISSADHFLYLPSIPVFILMVLGVRWLMQENERRGYVGAAVVKAGLGGFLLFLFLVTIEQNIYSRDELSMLKRSVAFQPKNARMQASLGLQYVFRDSPAEAQKHFQAAVDAEPLNPQYRISLGTSLCDQGRWIECMGQYVALDDGGAYNEMLERQKKMTIVPIEEEVAAGKDYDANGWFILGIYYAKVGMMDKAIDVFSKALIKDSQHSGALMNMGSLFEAKQDFPKALDFYSRVLQSPQATDFQKKFAQEHYVVLYSSQR